MIEAWWRSLKHQWLFLHSLDSVTTVQRLVAFYVDEHNRVLPHSAFRGQTPDEMYFGTGDAIPADLTSRATAARWQAVKPTDRPRARPARQSTRPHDHRCDHDEHGHESGRRSRENRRPHIAPVDGQEVSGIRVAHPSADPCPEIDENSRGKVQNVRGDSSFAVRVSTRDADVIAVAGVASAAYHRAPMLQQTDAPSGFAGGRSGGVGASADF
jgi:hypothetical protein